MSRLLIIIVSILLVFGSIFSVLTSINQKNLTEMLEYVDTFAEVAPKYDRPTAQMDEKGNYYFVSENAEDFKVLHLTDIHISGGFLQKESDKKAINAVAAMICAEKPDLVVVTGDIAYAIGIGGTINNSYAHDIFIHLMETLGVYWTVAFGNHDTEPYNFYKRDAVADMYADENLKYCLFQHSPEGVSGKGNHVINVKNNDGDTITSLFMIDSHSYIRQDFFGGLIDSLMWNYDNIKQDQIDWYVDMLEYYNPQNSMMFFHIPVTEVKTGYDTYIENNRQLGNGVNSFEGHDGETGDVVFPSKLGDQLFEVVQEKGNTKAMFFGHDHFNNFVMEYEGVIFSYGYSVDYIAYGDIGEKGYQRGCTVITLPYDGQFEQSHISHENYYQDKYQSLYEKEELDMYPHFDK